MKTTSAEPAEARVLDILDKYLTERRAGRAPDRDALLAKHPDLAESLAASFRALDFVHDAGRTLAAPAAAPGREEPAALGRELGDYRIVREIARGGMAVVYEAEQISLGRRVALKVLPFAAVLDAKQLQRFKNEAQAAAQIQHPHIVPVYAVGCDRGVHYYAMQYIEGQSLAVAIRELKEGGGGTGPKTPISSHASNRTPAYIRMAATLGVQAAQALDHAHQVGIVHRDVKPGNLLVDLAGTLWVTDFGLAHSRKDGGLTMTGELLGTIRYMSPEQALAKRTPIDHRTDVYSLGAALYELLTLEPAFPGDDPVQLLKDISSKEPAPPRRLNPALPSDVETVLLKAMSKDPAGRYATAGEMADDLGRFLENRPIEAKRPGLARRTVKWGRRNRVFVGVAAAVLLLAVAGLAIGTALLWREQKQTQAAFDRAESNLALALYALDQIYVKEALGNPRIRQGLPRDLLERGLWFYEEFARKNEYNQGLTLRHGDAYYRASLIFKELGQEDQSKGALERALLAFREVIRLNPDDSWGHLNLGNALDASDDFEGALKEYRKAISLKPDLAVAHYNLASMLESHANRDAIRLAPDRDGTYSNLGIAIREKVYLAASIQAFNEAIRLKPDYAEAYTNLGRALEASGNADGAIQAYGEAIKYDPDLIEARLNLSAALCDKGDFLGAEREARAGVKLRPDIASAHISLGRALQANRDLEGAIKEYNEAIRLQPDFVEAHYNLGNARKAHGDPAGAIEAYEAAIRLRSDYPEAHCNLASTLAGQGRYIAALPFIRKGHELGSKLAGWKYPSKKWLEMAEQRAMLEGRLDQVLSGEARPTDALERVAFAELLYAQSRHAKAAQMYVEAFAENAALAEDFDKGDRYNAACSASLAAARGGAEAAEWRGKALEWLRADLTAGKKVPSSLVPVLSHWKKDPDLVGIRDRIGELPEPEREAWRALWAAVDEALASARQAPR